MSTDPAIGKRVNQTPDTGLSTDKDGALFDVTQWRKEQTYAGHTYDLLNDILIELKKQTKILEDIIE